MKKTSLSILVPVFNEEHLVAESLRRLFVLENSPHLTKIQVIVVDDCSSDDTGKILRQLSQEFPQKSARFEWIFLRHGKNRGKGNAVQTALTQASCDIAIIHDADLEYHPKDIIRMIPLFVEEGADAVYGSRFAAHEYRRVLMFRHELGNRFLTFLSNLLSNLNLTDMETCYKAVRTPLLKSMPIRSNDFRLEPELTMKLAKRGAKIYEIPINYSGRTYQEGKKINWKDGFKALWAILKFGVSDDIFLEEEYGLRIQARLSRADRFTAWIADTIKPYVGQNVLEIGSGFGNITKKLIPRKSYYATDTHPFCLETAENLSADKPYLTVSHFDLEDISEFMVGKDRFDTIISLNVIEHLEDDQKAINSISQMLAKNGNALVLVPNAQWLFGALDKTLGHRRRYSKQCLKEMAYNADLKVHRIISFNRLTTIPWYILGKLLKKKTFGIFQLFMLNALTPLMRRTDRFIPLPPLSYIAVFTKK